MVQGGEQSCCGSPPSLPPPPLGLRTSLLDVLFSPLKNTGSSWAWMGLLGWRWVTAAVGLPSRNPVSNACPPPSQVMLVGDSGVGKTCLLVRFKDGAFLAGSFISTVGIDFRVSAWGAPRSLPTGSGR